MNVSTATNDDEKKRIEKNMRKKIHHIEGLEWIHDRGSTLERKCVTALTHKNTIDNNIKNVEPGIRHSRHPTAYAELIWNRKSIIENHEDHYKVPLLGPFIVGKDYVSNSAEGRVDEFLVFCHGFTLSLHNMVRH